MTVYRANGKQVLFKHSNDRGWSHFADAVSHDAADLIVAALHGPRVPEVDVPPGRHQVRQESDEYACSCGKRWSINDGEDHP